MSTRTGVIVTIVLIALGLFASWQADRHDVSYTYGRTMNVLQYFFWIAVIGMWILFFISNRGKSDRRNY